MRVWFAPILLAVLVVSAGVYIAEARKAPEQSEVSSVTSNLVQGLKRSPGTWSERSINVGATDQELGTPDITIDINVMRPVFIPSEIRVTQGQVVRLRLHGKDNGLADTPELQGNLGLKEFSGHGFQILGPYDVWVTGIRKDETKEVTFKASEAGEFAFECVVFCHPSHYLMQGKLIVEPQ